MALEPKLAATSRYKNQPKTSHGSRFSRNNYKMNMTLQKHKLYGTFGQTYSSSSLYHI